MATKKCTKAVETILKATGIEYKREGKCFIVTDPLEHDFDIVIQQHISVHNDNIEFEVCSDYRVPKEDRTSCLEIMNFTNSTLDDGAVYMDIEDRSVTYRMVLKEFDTASDKVDSFVDALSLGFAAYVSFYCMMADTSRE